MKFERAPDPGEQRNGDDAEDEEGRDANALGPFDDVRDGGVDENRVTAMAAEVIRTRTPVA